MHFSGWTAIFLFSSCVLAWMPGEHKDIFARDGTSLFNTTSEVSSLKSRTLSTTTKIRGVNLGSMFVFEPWMAEEEWSHMGCAGMQSEFDCVSKLGQAKANTVFQAHWDSWITQADLQKMKSYGLNTLRVPVGYWMKEDIVYDSEHFPQGGIQALQKLCGMASDLGMYIIIDLHGAPGAQVTQNSDTGQYASTAGFYTDYQYTRAVNFMAWITKQIHSNTEFRNVGMVELVNEPLQSTPDSMLTSYYPQAYKAIRDAETSLGVPHTSSLHVQIMNPKWGNNDPTKSLGGAYFLAYDDHRYIKYDTSVTVSQSAYISNACTSFRGTTDGIPTIVGEWSLSVANSVESTSSWSPSTHQSFYKDWFMAMATTWESQTTGWIFWSWKSQLGDPRWSYSDAVSAGLIPSNLATMSKGICSSY